MTSCPAMSSAIVASAPIRGPANVIVPTTNAPATPPSHSQVG